MSFVFNPFTGNLDKVGSSAPGTGDVVGPASATDNAIVRFDTTTGKLIQNSAITADDSGNVAGLGTINSKAIPSGDFVGTTDSQTLSNKTLTTPTIAQILNAGTLTLPTSTDTLVGRATTDTLTNKTLTTPVIGDFTSATHNHTNNAGGGQLTDAALSSAVGIAKGGTGQATAAAGFDALKQAATTTYQGVSELAISSEINTGTDATRTITPDAFAESNFGTQKVSIQMTDGSAALTTGNGKGYIRIPAPFIGMNLVGVAISVTSPSTSGTISAQVARGRQASPTSAHSFVDMLSTPVTIDQDEYDSKDATSPAVINGSNDDVAEGDLIRIDLDSVGSGPTAVFIAQLLFRLP